MIFQVIPDIKKTPAKDRKKTSIVPKSSCAILILITGITTHSILAISQKSLFSRSVHLFSIMLSHYIGHHQDKRNLHQLRWLECKRHQSESSF